MSKRKRTAKSDQQSQPNTDVAQPAEPAVRVQESHEPEDPSATEKAVGEVQQRLDEALVAADAFKDQFLRAKAEAENTRRRAETDVRNARKYAIEGFASELLNVRDSLELARSIDLNQQDTNALQKMLEGLELTLKQMDTVFEKFGVSVVAPQPGDKLDPDRHQAMSVQESTEVAPNHIVSVVQKGYLLKDRLIRPAMVIVATAAAPADSGQQATENA